MELRHYPSVIYGSRFVLSDFLSSAEVARAPYWTNDIFLTNKSFQNPKVHYHIHNSPQHRPILRDINSVYAASSYFLQIYFNIILPSTSRSSKWSLSFRFSPPKFCMHFFYIPDTNFLVSSYRPIILLLQLLFSAVEYSVFLLQERKWKRCLPQTCFIFPFWVSLSLNFL
jgi:hypothetical protein